MRLNVLFFSLLLTLAACQEEAPVLNDAAAAEVEVFTDTQESKFQEQKFISETDENYSADCHKDTSKAPKEDNYDFTCLSPTAMKNKLTTCCASSTSEASGCCDRDAVKGVGDPDKMKRLVGTMGGVTGALAIGVFLCTWCDKESFPCLETLEMKITATWQHVKDNAFCCKKGAQEREDLRELEEQGGVNYDCPDHVKDGVRDDYFDHLYDYDNHLPVN